MDADTSIVEYFGETISSSCGYCKTTDPDKFTHGMWAHKLSTEDYNALLDRGWRRSGKYLYKPTLNRTCCPQYTIRCDANAFKPTKKHKRVLKIVQDYLATGKQPNKCAIPATGGDRAESHEMPLTKATSKSVVGTLREETVTTSELAAVQTTAASENKPKENVTHKEVCSEDAAKTSTATRQPRLGKKKEMRKQRALQRLAKKGIDAETAQKMRLAKVPQPKSLEDRLEQALPSKPAHRLEFRLVRSHPVSREFSRTLTESHATYAQYQTTVHGDPPSKPSLSQYRRFLCDSPLNEKKPSSSSADFAGFGSFHQQYLLDGKIIAVGVLDILPHCVSAKYFYYDPAYQFLSLGTYSALVEIALVRKLAKIVPALRWYYMGFYIDSCPKMRYKGRYLPSDLLCPETFTWVPIEKCLPKLAVSKYARFASNDIASTEDDTNIDQVAVLCNGLVTTYGALRQLKNPTVQDGAEVQEYARLVGSTCAKRMLLYRQE
uniref:Arginyl-tRNA--protein transferase 1 n=1 Tax=Plectus sambesii TaxID=2011161 RepID=A0A914WND2_9BILA